METVTDLIEQRKSVPAVLLDLKEWQKQWRKRTGKSVTTRALYDELFMRRGEAVADGDGPMVDRVTEIIYRLSDGLAVKYASKWSGSPDLFEEVLSAARVGLFEAISTYDFTGAAWTSWAYVNVKKRALDAAWKALPERGISRNAFRSRQAILLEAQRWAQECRGVPVDYGVVALRLGVSVTSVRQVLESVSVVPLDAPLGGSDGGSLVDVLADSALSPEDVCVLAESSELLFAAVVGLPERVSLVVQLHFGVGPVGVSVGPLGVADIAGFLGVSVGVVRGLLVEGLVSLRGVLGDLGDRCLRQGRMPCGHHDCGDGDREVVMT